MILVFGLTFLFLMFSNSIDAQIYYDGVSFGVGTDDPEEFLDVNGKVKLRSQLIIRNLQNENKIKLTAQGNEDSYILGHLGIGTMIPEYELDVLKNIRANRHLIVGGNHDNKPYENGKLFIRNLQNENKIKLTAQRNEDSYILGHLGIGTMIPEYELDVLKNIRANRHLIVGGNHDNKPYENGKLFIRNLHNENKIKLTAQGNEDSYILGHLGIGTMIPEYELDVLKDIRAKRHLIVGGNHDNKPYENGKLFITNLHNENKIKLTAQRNECSFIEGKLLIGSTDITNNVNNSIHKLLVEGSIGARQVIVESQGWSDYVFTSDYKLPSLEEVEKYINENGHLKDIPSADEVSEKGIDLGKMDSGLLMKVEELTLYIIEQNKKMETVIQQNVELSNRLKKLEAQH